MGYTTEFEGSFKINKELDDETFNLIWGISKTRRMKRFGLDDKYGIDGEFYFEDGDTINHCQSFNPSMGKIVNYNEPPSSQPGLWCQWTILEDRITIEHDGGEKFYYYIEWIKYLIDRILKPRGYIVSGSVKWKGEESSDFGLIQVDDNRVYVSKGLKKYSTPTLI